MAQALLAKESCLVIRASMVQRQIIRKEERPSRPARLDHLPDNLGRMCNRMQDRTGVDATRGPSDCTELAYALEIGAHLLSIKEERPSCTLCLNLGPCLVSLENVVTISPACGFKPKLGCQCDELIVTFWGLSICTRQNKSRLGRLRTFGRFHGDCEASRHVDGLVRR